MGNQVIWKQCLVKGQAILRYEKKTWYFGFRRCGPSNLTCLSKGDIQKSIKKQKGFAKSKILHKHSYTD